MLESILGNLEEVAGKLGIPADTLQSVVETIKDKGADPQALLAAAQEHGLPVDKLQGLLGGSGEGLLGGLTGMIDKDGDGNPVNDVLGIAKGLFGKD